MDPVTDSSLPPTELSDFVDAGSADEADDGDGATKCEEKIIIRLSQ